MSFALNATLLLSSPSPHRAAPAARPGGERERCGTVRANHYCPVITHEHHTLNI